MSTALTYLLQTLSQRYVDETKAAVILSLEVVFGCLWAPDIIYDRENRDYLLHWSSSHSCNDYGRKGIYYSRTKDFKEFGAPEVLYRKEDSGVIDSAIYEENGWYYMFVKSEGNPEKIILLRSAHAAGPYERVEAFDESMERY